MAKQTLNNAESGSVIRGKINDNFTEVYDDVALKANLSAPIIIGAWDLRGGYGDGGARAYANAGAGKVGVGFYNYFGTLTGTITSDNSGVMLVNGVAVETANVISNRFIANEANGGAANAPLFRVDYGTTGNVGGFYCPQSGSPIGKQYWCSDLIERVMLDRTGRFEILAGTDFVMNPATSETPTANGNLVIEATSNTSLTFKYKGSDGTVRSGSITLS